MSSFYSVEVILNAHHNENNITRIIEHGTDLGFIYYGWDKTPSPIILTSQEAKTFLLTILTGDENDLSDAYLTVVFKDTDFLMRIDPIENYTRISIFSFGQPWQRQIDRDSYTIDFARYIRLVLELCKDFPILELTTARDL
jgi:hypothetical protein